MNHFVPVRSAVVATGLLAALAAIPAAHATPVQSSASPSAASTATPNPVPPKSAGSVPTQASSAPPSAEPAAPGGKGDEASSAAPSAAPGGKGDEASSAAPSAAPTEPGTPAPAATKPAPAEDELAHTGSSNTTNTVLGAGAVALVAGGAGTLFAVRRRSHR